MIPKNKRLDRKEFRGVFLSGKKIQGLFSTLIFKKINSNSKFSVTAPTSVFKKAVIRNKARRRAYTALRPLLPTFKTGFFGVFILRKDCLSVSIEFLTSDILKMLNMAVSAKS